MYTALTIAGSDCSGGAGIQADLKTFGAHGVYGMSVITALTAQNTCGVYKITDTPVSMVEAQMKAVFEDIYPNSVKIGMVSSAEIIYAIVEGLKFYKAKNIVIDPVMISTSGHKLLPDSAIQALMNHLMPLADIITPNLFEAESVCGFKIDNKQDMIKAANVLSSNFQGNILIKGGHLQGDHDDLLFHNGAWCWFEGKHIDNPNTHGTGCTLSSAISANLARGLKMADAVHLAKKYIEAAIGAKLNLGNGKGPLNHLMKIPN